MHITKKVIGFCLILAMIKTDAIAQTKQRTYRKITQRELLDTLFQCTVIKDQVYLDGDIYLGDTTELNRLQNLAFAFVVDDNFILQTRWQNNTIPVEFDNNFLMTEKNVIITALNEMMALTYIRFKFRTNENDYIFYKKVSESQLGFCGGSSPVGRKSGKQEIRISCLSPKIVKHETLHSLGFYHEQSRTDRDNFSTILTANIEAGAESNFDKHLFFVKDIGGYDFRSIMHYGAFDFGIKVNGVRKQTIRSKVNPPNTSFSSSELSSGDIDALKAIYPMKNIARAPLPVYNDMFSDNQEWTTGPYFGTKGTFLADVNGDRKADAIVVNNDLITVRRSNGSVFTPNESWTTIPFFGNKGTYFADVNGDGKADAIAVSVLETRVRKSTGSSFGPAERWIDGFFGDKGVFFVDVTGDGKADAILAGESGIRVRVSDGISFGASERWIDSDSYGTKGTFFADVNGDNKADAIVVNDGGIVVRVSRGTSFSQNFTWSSQAYVGTRGNYFSDVNGDGKADAIVVNENGISVRRSRDYDFMPTETGTSNPYLADIVMLFGDVTGSGKCAAVVVNNNIIVVRPAY